MSHETAPYFGCDHSHYHLGCARCALALAGTRFNATILTLWEEEEVLKHVKKQIVELHNQNQSQKEMIRILVSKIQEMDHNLNAVISHLGLMKEEVTGEPGSVPGVDPVSCDGGGEGSGGVNGQEDNTPAASAEPGDER